MAGGYLALGVLLLLAGVAQAEEQSDVLVLTDGTIDEALRENEYILVEFYAPWCGHCKRLAPEYEKAATLLKERGSKAKVAKVDSTVEKNSASRFGIRGYPTLLFFKNGEQLEKYSSQRTAEAIVEYCQTKAGETRAAEL
jgi:protein disulfide-isomerase-like protein